MSTLFSQPPRWEHDFSGERIAELAKNLAKKEKITFSEALECIKVEITLHDYDTKDEQLAGFGELCKELNETLSSIVRMINDR